MDYFLVVLLVLLCFFVVCVLTELYNTYSSYGQKISKFRGPKPLPILGNMFDIIVDSETIFKKLRFYAKCYQPLYILWSSCFFCAVNIVTPDDMQNVLSNVKHNDKSDIYLLFNEWLGEGLLTSNGDKWQLRRKILTPTFHFNILKQFIRIFNKHANDHVKDLEGLDKENYNVMPSIHKVSLHTIAESAMGTTMSDKTREMKYRSAIHRMGEIMVWRIMRPWFYFYITNIFHKNFYQERFLLRFLKDFTNRVITKREEQFDELSQQKVNNIQDDEVDGKKHRLAMLDLLLSAKKRKEIDNDGVREEVDTFMFEGHDTISMAISFTYMLLACNKDAQDKIYNELTEIFKSSDRDATYEDFQNMKYMEMAIKESMRIYPSVPLISRVTGEDLLTKSGLVIPKGVPIFLHIYDVHHDPSIYPEPEKFDPERFTPENIKGRHPYAYLPFSAGSRNCIGQKYAMLNMKSILTATLRAYELLPIDTPETIVLIADIILRSKNGIRLKLKPRLKIM